MAIAFLYLPLLAKDLVPSAQRAQFGFCITPVPCSGKGLLHVTPFLIECSLPQVDLSRVQTKLSLHVSLGLAAAFEQSQCFNLELSAVYFLGWHLARLGGW